MEHGSSPDRTGGGVPYSTKRGSIERELVAAITRVAGLEEELAEHKKRIVVYEGTEQRFLRGVELIFRLNGTVDVTQCDPWIAAGSLGACNKQFCEDWAKQCRDAGLEVKRLVRTEGGLCTPNEAKQLRIHLFNAPHYEELRMMPHSQCTEHWSFAECEILRDSFVRTMEMALGVRSLGEARYIKSTGDTVYVSSEIKITYQPHAFHLIPEDEELGKLVASCAWSISEACERRGGSTEAEAVAQ